MTQNPKQQQEKIQQSNSPRFRNLIVMYLDILIRSLISFVCIGVVLSIFLIGFLHLSWIFVLPLSFFVAILVAPLFMKIQLADKILTYYESLLKKSFKLQ